MGEAESLARDVTDAVGALRAGHPSAARALLDRVWTDPAFRAASDLDDVRARVASLRAQAAFHAGDLGAAEALAAEALRRARLLGDAEGIAEVTELLAGVRERRAKADGPTDAQADALRRATLAELLSLRDPVARAEALLRRATLGDLDPDGVLAAAELAWREGAAQGNVRVQVLARLCAAHADPDHAALHLAAAHEAALAADGAPDRPGVASPEALVTAIARTAGQLGVPTPVQRGPLGPPREAP